MKKAPVITVDGPSGTGKGTVAQNVAARLEWRYLDSGALYRSAAWGAQDIGVDIENELELTRYLKTLHIEMAPMPEGDAAVFCQGADVSSLIRAEKIGLLASRMSSNPLVRDKLFNIQLASREPPGLVTDGRDMGTVVFPDAILKFFLDASANERANRRCKQLQEAGINVNFAEIEADLIKRDQRDRSRSLSPTVPASGAVIIDTTRMTIQQVMEQVVAVVDAA